MVAKYQILRDRGAAAVNLELGELIQLSFFKGGSVDTSRVAVEPFQAVLRTGERKAKSPDRRSELGRRVPISSSGGQLAIARATYTGALPQTGDQIRALDRPGKPWFDVRTVDNLHHARIYLELGDA